MALIDKYLNQTAVYWPTPTKDLYGKLSFGTAIEISVRWTEKSELFLDNEGKESLSQAVVHVNQDVELEGYLYLGELTDLSVAEKADPQLEDNAYPIRQYKKTTGIKAKQYVRRVWL